MTIGGKIKELRTKLGMKQSDLAEKSGISRVSVGNYERGDRIPNGENIKKIAEALGVTANELIEPQVTSSQKLLYSIIPSKTSIEKLALESNVPLDEVVSIFHNENRHTTKSFFDLFSFLGLDRETITKLMISDSVIDSIYNNDGTDSTKNTLKKIYTEDPLTLNDILPNISDEDKDLISTLYTLGAVPGTDTYIGSEMEENNYRYDLQHSNALIDMYIEGIRTWSENRFLSKDESKAIKEHFAELLLRYKNLINCIVDSKMGFASYKQMYSAYNNQLPNPLTDKQIKEQYFKQALDKQLSGLSSYISSITYLLGESSSNND